MNYFLSLIDQYSDNIHLFLVNHVVLAPLLLLFAEESGIPILVPGDAIIGYVGFRLSQTHTAALWEAFVLALFAVIVGSTILFYISKLYGQFVLTKLSKFIFLKQKHLDRAEHMFNKYGIWAIIFGRHIPGLRIPITIFAASSGVKYWVFLVGTIISTALWILFYLSIGSRYGSDIQQVVTKYVIISVITIVCIVIAVVGLHIYGLYKESKLSKTAKTEKHQP